MASCSQQHVRLRLFFTNKTKYPPTWMLIDKKNCETILDVENQICQCVLKRNRAVDIYMQDCILPKWESSSILKDDDKLEIIVNSKNNHGTKDCKRKEKFEETRKSVDTKCNSIHDNLPKKRKKENDIHVSAQSNEKRDTSTVKQIDVKQSESDKPLVDGTKCNGNQSTGDANHSLLGLSCIVNGTDKPTVSSDKKRKRKRHRKKSNKAEDNDTTSVSSSTPVTFRKSWTPASKPVHKDPQNKHKKFEDMDVQIIEDAEEPTQIENTKLKSSFTCEVSTNGGSKEVQLEAMKRDLLMKVDSLSDSRTSEDDHKNDKQNNLSSYNYKGNSSEKSSDAGAVFSSSPVPKSPTKLEISTLSNGVPVYSRRRNNQAPTFEMTKQQQLNTQASHRSFFLENKDHKKTNASKNPREDKYNGEEIHDIEFLYKDYSNYPPLHGFPQTGDKIAYKVIELSENYTPEVSSYKEAQVIEFQPDTHLVTLNRVVPDKKQSNEDEEPIVQLHWNSILEPLSLES